MRLRARLVRQQQVAAHAQVHQQGIAGFQIEEKEFGASTGGRETVPRQGFEAAMGQGLTQPLVAGGDLDDLSSHEVALHGVAHGFYFGQFRHR